MEGASAAEPDRALLAEAADWLMRFQCGGDTVATQRDFEQWRAQSPAHAAAWQRAEAVSETFRCVPAELGRRALDGLASPARRRALHVFGVAAIAGPAAWLALRHRPWLAWQADLATRTGEQRSVDLADGTRLVLDTASAVDVTFTADERRLHLIKGEILVTTARDPSSRPRPFVVTSAEGRLRPIGTRFSVRQLSGHTRVAVFDGAVEIITAGGQRRTLSAGSQADFRADGIGAVSPVDEAADLWAKGMLLARDMPLGELIAELARYRSGVLRCDPAVGGVRVSGAFPLTDTDASLDLLVKTRPLVLRRRTRYWIDVVPRADGATHGG